MCGIVGYIGNQKATPILLAGLSKLEYRGYDSAGIATIEKNKIEVSKDKGRVENLANLKETKNLNGSIGIAHTRWATHGIPSKINSHPHLDKGHNFAVVHNGIIENYNELRSFLESNDYVFISNTDTEVIPNLIDYFYNKDTLIDDKKVLRAIKSACEKLVGSFSLCILSVYMPNNMIVVRKDSPLVVGKGKNENYIASDIPAILGYTKNFYLLNNFEYVVLSRDNIKFFDKDLKQFDKKTTLITWDVMSADKCGYSDYMLKEMMEQPTAIRETIGSRLDNNKCNFEDLNFSKEYLLSLEQIYIIGCGTAMHAGLAVKNTIEHLCKIHVSVELASEFRYRKPILNNKTLCIFISQSGETADTIAALKLSKENCAKTLAVSNVIGSSISREADFVIYTHAGPEIAVASTKAYTSQVVLLTLLSIYFAEILEYDNLSLLQSIKNELLELPNKVAKVLSSSSNICEIAKNIFNVKDLFYLGRGIDYATALEASLKLKEISYIHSECYAAGELKHGPIALIEKDVNVIGIMTDETLVKKTVSNLEEVNTRGALTTAVISEDISNKIDKSIFNNVIVVPTTSNYLSPVTTIVALQLLAYYVSKEKGIDVDKPRNLAKSVTVE